MKPSPRDIQHMQSDIEICNLLINVIDAICIECPKLSKSYILSDYKAEIQHLVRTKTNQIKVDKKEL